MDNVIYHENAERKVVKITETIAYINKVHNTVTQFGINVHSLVSEENLDQTINKLREALISLIQEINRVYRRMESAETDLKIELDSVKEKICNGMEVLKEILREIPDMMETKSLLKKFFPSKRKTTLLNTLQKAEIAINEVVSGLENAASKLQEVKNEVVTVLNNDPPQEEETGATTQLPPAETETPLLSTLPETDTEAGPSTKRTTAPKEVKKNAFNISEILDTLRGINTKIKELAQHIITPEQAKENASNIFKMVVPISNLCRNVESCKSCVDERWSPILSVNNWNEQTLQDSQQFTGQIMPRISNLIDEVQDVKEMVQTAGALLNTKLSEVIARGETAVKNIPDKIETILQTVLLYKANIINKTTANRRITLSDVRYKIRLALSDITLAFAEVADEVKKALDMIVLAKNKAYQVIYPTAEEDQAQQKAQLQEERIKFVSEAAKKDFAIKQKAKKYGKLKSYLKALLGAGILETAWGLLGESIICGALGSAICPGVGTAVGIIVPIAILIGTFVVGEFMASKTTIEIGGPQIEEAAAEKERRLLAWEEKKKTLSS
jgi:hypothetical protein